MKTIIKNYGQLAIILTLLLLLVYSNYSKLIKITLFNSPLNDKEKIDESSKGSNGKNTYSIAIRLRRVTYEDAYLSVPVTDRITEKKVDGSYGIDFKKFVAEGIKLSHDPRVEWKVETINLEPHPSQNPLPKDRKTFDPLNL